jgi:very-short-patch-repair endonuclease
MTEPNPPLTAARAALARLRAKLLDLTKRTSLLNWRARRGAATAIVVVDEIPREVFRILVVEEKAMRFRPDLRVADDETALALGDEEPIPALLDGGAPQGEQHTDLWLQTRLSPTQLDQHQRRIADRTESIREEQGVNTLFLAMGMLHYYEAEASDELRRAPILLVPVELVRPAANRPFQLTIGDDDLVLNPALVEMMKREFGIALPQLADDSEQIDVEGLFGQIRQLIGRLPRWGVEEEIVLSTFSFLKFVMYKDLEANEETFLLHRLFRLLSERRGGGGFGLPAGIKNLDLDRERPPEDTFEVLDADSSQQRAIAAVARGHDLVVQGPPGTGKSQTIVNLVAGALAEEKTVLFVSEKRAALDVVHRRLQEAGLGDFCLELHSQKANKREIIKGIARALDRTLVPHGATERLREQLPLSRAKLSEYVAALHAVHQPLGASVYQAVGRLARLREAPLLAWPGTPDEQSGKALEVAVTSLERLTSAARLVGDPADHPWRDSALDRIGSLFAQDRERLRHALEAANRLVLEGGALAAEARASLGVAAPATLAEARGAGAIAELMEASPGAPLEVLTSPEWNAAPARAAETIEIGRRASGLRAAALERFRPETLERGHATDVQVVLRYQAKLYRMLVRGYRAARRRFLDARLAGYRATLGEQARHFREIDVMRADRDRLAREDGAARALFGRHWRGRESDWDALARYVEWVVRFRAACIREQLQPMEAARVVSEGAPATTSLRRLAEVGAALAAELQVVGEILGWPSSLLEQAELEAIAARVRAMLDAEQRLGEWVAWLRAREEVGQTAGAPFLVLLDQGKVEAERVVAAFARSFYEAWVAARVRASPVLTRFEAQIHEADVGTFRHLDEGVLRENRDRLVSLLRTRGQDRLQRFLHTSAWSFLQTQLVRQRGHAPVRKLLQHAFEPIRAIKPCFMMSPLMVAQCLQADPQAFDLVIFDEASQLTPQDAIGAVVRGKQLVVVGDQRQLPPTSFFDVQLSGGDEHAAAGDEPGWEDLESILEQYQAAGLPDARLRWHYRSRHESLIAFSNAHIYDWDLLTFPSADADTRHRGLVFEYVPDGVYLGGGLNTAEARRVVDAVIEHARRHPDSSLGVGTLNLRQQLAVQDEIERRRRDDPLLEPFFSLDKPEPFFVKNLENIQGDERDVIFLSVTFGRGHDGVLRHNFGPINGQNGHRRLNVLVTRARERMVVYSSMRGDEIDLTKTQAKGAQLLRDFLLYAERGHLVSARLDAMLGAESPFEREVLGELEARGLRVVPQVGVGPYRVDIGVLDDEVPGRFICGIECDGAAYHQSETARDRDRLREQVLRRLGWRLHRVWSTDWFKWRDGQVERLLRLVEASRREARAESAARPGPSGASQGPAGAAADAPADPAPVEPEFPSVRPPLRAREYELVQPESKGSAEELLSAADREIGPVLTHVVRIEGPIHRDDLFSRVAQAWQASKVGKRIQARLERALAVAATQRAVVIDGEFVSLPDHPVRPRSRAGTGIPADRIAPAEYQAAIVAVLATGPRSRETLRSEAGRLLGFDRIGSRLEERLAQALEVLLADGRIGQGSNGLALRDGSFAGT